MEVQRTKDRPRRVVLTKLFAWALASLTERCSDWRADKTFNCCETAWCQEVGIASEVSTILEVIFNLDALVEVERTNHPVEQTFCVVRSEANFLRESVNLCVVRVATDQVSTCEV